MARRGLDLRPGRGAEEDLKSDPGGLTAAELALAVAELQPALASAAVEDVVCLRERDDLMLVLRMGTGRHLLLFALGGARARITITTRRFAKEQFATGPQPDALRKLLHGAEVTGLQQAPGERRVELGLRSSTGKLQLYAELFGTRGLWCITDRDGRIIEMSRPVETAVRKLGLGSAYVPPPARATAEAEPAVRFAPPVLAAIDAYFSERDAAEAAATERDQVLRALDRARKRAAAAVAGLQTQASGAANAVLVRREADLMLAYAHAVRRGATVMEVPDPETEGNVLRIELDPALPVVNQAKARYERARRMEDGVATAAARLANATTLSQRLEELARALQTDPEAFPALREECQDLGLLPRTAKPAAAKPKARAATGARQFTSAEGLLILVGRSNEENDRLTRQSGGNDLWLHVGQGYAGSHVVIRLPRNRTASLDTLLDAGTLAVHFSKARGARSCEVVYTQCKHVKKPKGAPPGRVVPHLTKALQVRLDEVRLRRLLDGAAGSGP